MPLPVSSESQAPDRRGSGLGVGSNRGVRRYVESGKCCQQTGETAGELEVAGGNCGWVGMQAGRGSGSIQAERLGGESKPNAWMARSPERVSARGAPIGINRASQSPCIDSSPRRPCPWRIIAETTTQNGKTKTVLARNPSGCASRVKQRLIMRRAIICTPFAECHGLDSYFFSLEIGHGSKGGVCLWV